MTSRPITPVFRWLAARSTGPAAADASSSFATTTPGNHAGEAAFLAVAVFSLTATGVIPLTETISPAILRWLTGAGLLFLLPHLIMGMVSLLLFRVTADPARRTEAQDWGCLAAMTLYAGWRGFEVGWESVVCRIWLGFVLCNLPFLLREWSTAAPPHPPAPAS